MTESKNPVGDQAMEDADLVIDSTEGDAADTAGVAAAATADKMDDEVDSIAATAAPAGPGHGPSADEAEPR